MQECGRWRERIRDSTHTFKIRESNSVIEEREQKMKKLIMGSLAILLGVLSISIPFAGIHTAEAKTTENTDKTGD